jgi:glycosyltransferase involved in cell wall biosynthesis
VNGSSEASVEVIPIPTIAGRSGPATAVETWTLPARPPGSTPGRVRRDGKFLARHGQPFRIRGVTYGTFLPRGDGELFPVAAATRVDFERMARLGLNTVRLYTPPPEDVLELAGEAGLQLVVGLDYRDWRCEPEAGRAARRRVLEAGRRAVDSALERCAGREVVLAVAVGNEVPGDIVRLHGAGAVEDTLARLVEEVHRADPEVLVTYCNYPTTEYLQVPGQDLVCFNVFLESRERFRSYLRHLQVVAGDRPLVLSELGLAAELHGETAQASALGWQLSVVDECGGAGAAVFSWTDEWAVAGRPVEGWGFGISDVRRCLKPAAGVVRRWAASDVGDLLDRWPAISVVVCAFNAAATLPECLRSLLACDYPALEVIVCDDGSTDGTAEIASAFPFRLLRLEHVGLSGARNAGIAAARGEIVAFLDADAACHPEWPYHLALSLDEESVQATGGPNLPFEAARLVERAVARAPGNPVEVLISDARAEHVPGCNMAYRRDALLEVGGFDPVYVTAGDDVDLCWKLLDRGHEIAFAAAAQVRHHRRSAVGSFLRQQIGYGRAERLISQRHGHRFNRLGQARWTGFIYGTPSYLPRLLRPVVYQGTYGLAPFQGVVRRRAEEVGSYASALLPLAVPVTAAGLLLSVLSPWWLLLPGLAVLLVAAFTAVTALAVRPDRSEPRPLALRLLAALLHLAQPVARAWGRLQPVPEHPLPSTPPPPWTGDRATWLLHLERCLIRLRCGVRSGTADSRWDLQTWVGPMVHCRLTTAVAWHWYPFHRRQYRPRPWGLLALLAAACVWLTTGRSGAGEALLAVLVAAAAVETAVLRSLVSRAVAGSTALVSREPGPGDPDGGVA